LKCGESCRGDGGGKWNSLFLDAVEDDGERNFRVASWESGSGVELLSRPSNFLSEFSLIAFFGGGGKEVCGGGGRTLGCKCFGCGNEVIASSFSALNSCSLSESPCASSRI
jgi:hypothetical protein